MSFYKMKNCYFDAVAVNFNLRSNESYKFYEFL